MKMLNHQTALVLLMISVALLQAQTPAANPDVAKSFRPGELWPDNNGVHINAHGGGMLLHEGTYYWFGEHKIEGDAGNYAQVGVHVYSSKDLYNWKDEGIALKVSDDPKSDITRGCILERPKVIFNRKTGKFVMWFHLELKGRGYSAARTGVAVSDQPAGPYQYIESVRPCAGFWPDNVSEDQKKSLSEEERHPAAGTPKPPVFRRDFEGGQMARDMTLFVDDDGTAYHIAASEENSTLHLCQLSDDYLKFTGRYVRIFPGASNEAPALFKRKGKYYMISSGCTGWAPNAARSAVADSIWGPWTALGNPCAGTKEQMNNTFESQSTYVLPLPDRTDAYIFMADRWRPKNAIDGRYIWLPIRWREDKPVLDWMDTWDLSVFDPRAFSIYVGQPRNFCGVAWQAGMPALQSNPADVLLMGCVYMNCKCSN